jgi:prepilin-type N-terminal cleavage/methylation domain-containing protein
MKKNKGFTLVELLVVIAIIGLLSTLAVVSLGNIREKGRDTKRLSDMDAMRTAMELVNSEYGSYSTDLGCAAGAKVSTCKGKRLQEFLATVKNLNDPSGTANCSTACTTTCNYAFKTLASDDYEVYFYLETGAANFTTPGCYKIGPTGIELL